LGAVIARTADKRGWPFERSENDEPEPRVHFGHADGCACRDTTGRARDGGAPANDDFADARTVTGVPFSDTVEVTGATLETGEPVSSCRETAAPNGTVWYAFTPSRTTTVEITRTAEFESILTVYTGRSLSSLTERACVFSGTLSLRLIAKKTYYLQIGTFFDQTGALQLDITRR
jgi:hypothetical protein